MNGRILDWRHDAPSYADWTDAIYRLIISMTRGGYKRDELDQMPLEEVLTLAEMLIDQVTITAPF